MEIKEISEDLQEILDTSLKGLVLREDCVISYTDDFKGKDISPGEAGKARVTVELDMRHFTVRKALGKAVSPLKIQAQNSKRKSVRDRTDPIEFTEELHNSVISVIPGAPRESIKDPVESGKSAIDRMDEKQLEEFREYLNSK